MKSKIITIFQFQKKTDDVKLGYFVFINGVCEQHSVKKN